MFIKSVSPAQNPDSPGMTRREAHIAACLPANAPAPALLHTLDDGEWITLVFEEVDGRHPHEPWQADELARVFAAIRALGDLEPRRALPPVARQYGEMFTGWRMLVREGPDAVTDGWCRAHLEDLAVAEALWEAMSVGPGLIHGDVRSDNVLFTEDGSVTFVDWTSTCTGAAWFEVVLMLPSIALEGGGEPESVLRERLRRLDVDACRSSPRWPATSRTRPPARSAGLPTLRRSSARRAKSRRVAARLGPRGDGSASSAARCRTASRRSRRVTLRTRRRRPARTAALLFDEPFESGTPAPDSGMRRRLRRPRVSTPIRADVAELRAK